MSKNNEQEDGININPGLVVLFEALQRVRDIRTELTQVELKIVKSELTLSGMAIQAEIESRKANLALAEAAAALFNVFHPKQP